MDNIRVTIRVRPLVQREILKEAESHWEVNENTIYQVENGIPVPSNPFNPTTFVFDRVYSKGDSTESIYNQFAKPLVCKAMEGFNGTIFAYGQTGTGKTFTMMGEPDNPGITPRTINDIFSMVQMAPDREFLIRVSYMEIYNEVITDLLKSDGSNLKIRNNERNEIFVEHLTEVPISSPVDALTCLESGEQRRRFGVTNMNERSSRSHTIFRITIESKLTNANDSCCEDGAVIVSQLNLVDLAGSERAAQTGAQGTRLKESGYINKSLLALGTVISKLSSAGDERAFIPYRDSKLTRILQNSLGGNAKTSVIATVSAAAGEETFSTLKFASRAKTIKNKPTVNEVLDGDTMIRRYRKEINMLKQQIDEMNNLTKVKTLMTENEKMEQLLEENERKREEQELKINGLQKLIISASEQTISLKRKASSKLARRETWCPGKLKRSLAPVSILDVITDQESEDDSEKEPTFAESKTSFMRELDREERRSCEEFKRKRSKDSGSAAAVKYRRSYQSGTLVELKIDRSCQTEPSEAASVQDVSIEQEAEKGGNLMERLATLSEENAGLTMTIQRLTNRLEELEAQCLNDEVKDERARRNLVGTRRRSVSATSNLPPSAKKKKYMSTPSVESSFCRGIPSAETPATSKLEKTVNDSLLEFMEFEKDFKIEELITKLNEAQSTIDDLKKLESTVEDMQYKNDELQLENEALKEKDRKQSSHLELLAKENFELQRDRNADNGNYSSEFAVLKAELTALKEEKENLLRELDDERWLRRTDAEKYPEKLELKTKIVTLNDTHQGDIECKNLTLKEHEENLAAKKFEMGLINTEISNVDLDEHTRVKEDTYEEGYERMRTQVEELDNMRMKLKEIEEKNRELFDDKMEMLKQIEEEAVEKCLLKEKFDEISLKFAQLEQINAAVVKSVDGDWRNTEGQYWLQNEEVEKLRMIVNELEELNQTVLNNVFHKERFTEETVDENSTEVEQRTVGEADSEANEKVPQTEGNAKINDEAKYGYVKRKLETLKLRLKELEQGDSHLCSAVSNKNLLDRNNCLEEKLEALQINLNEMEECNKELCDEIASKDSLTQNVCLREELEALQMKLSEMEECNKEPRNEIASKDSLSQNVCVQEELEALQMKLNEMEECNKELRDEIEVKDSLTQNVCLQEELEALQMKLNEMEECNKELRDEIASKDSRTQNVCLQEELEALQMKLNEMEECNKELRDEIASKDSLTQNVCLQEELEALQMKLSEMEECNKELRDEIEVKDSRTQNVCLQEELGALQMKLNEMEECNKELRDEIASKDSRTQNVCLQEELEALQMKLNEMEECNKELRDEIASKDSRTQNVCLQEELEALQMKLSELEECNKELRDEIASKDSLTHNVCLQEELEALQMKLSEMEECNKELRDEIASKDSLSQNVCLQEELEALQMKLNEMEECNKELRDEIASKDSLSQNVCLQEELEALQMKLNEMEECNKELRDEIASKDSLSQNVCLQEELEALQMKLNEMEECNKELRDEIAGKNSLSQNVCLKEELGALQMKLNEMEECNKELRDEIASKDSRTHNVCLQEELEALQMKLSEMEECNKELRNEIAGKDSLSQNVCLKEELGALQMKLNEIEECNKELRDEIASKDSRTQNVCLQEELEALQMKLSEMEECNKELRNEIASKDSLSQNVCLQEELEALKVKLKEMEKRNNQLENENDSMHKDEMNEMKVKLVELEESSNIFQQEVVEKNVLIQIQKEEASRRLEEGEEMRSQSLILEEINKGLVAELKEFKMNQGSEINLLLKSELEEENRTKEIKSLKEELSEIDDVQKGNESYDEHMEHLTLKVMELEEKNEELRSELVAANLCEKERNELLEKLASLEEEFHLMENTQKIEELQAEFNRIEAKNEDLLKEIKEKSILLSEKESELEEHLQSAKEFRLRLDELNSENSELRKDIAKGNELLNEFEKEEKNFSEMADLEAMNNELRKAMTDKEGEISLLKSKTGDLTRKIQEEIDLKEIAEENVILLEKKIESMQVKIDDAQRLEESQVRFNEIEAKNEELHKEIKEKSSLLSEKENELEACLESAKEFCLKLDELKAENSELRKEIAKNNELISEFEKEKENFSEISDLEAMNNELRKAMTGKEAELLLLKSKTEDLARKILEEIDLKEIAEENIILLEKKIESMQGKIDDLMETLEEARNDQKIAAANAQKLEELQARFNEIETKNEELHKEIKEKSTLLSEKESELEEHLQSAKEFRLRLDELNSENSELRKEIAKNNELISEFEKEKDNFSEMANLEAMNNELRKAMTDKEGEISLLKSKTGDLTRKIQEEIGLKENAEENVILLEKKIESMQVKIDDLKETLEKANKDQMINANLDAEEIDELNEEIRKLNATIEKERKAAQEQFTKIEKYYLEKLKKQRGEVCIGVSLEKENRKLKEQLEKNERAKISYEEYQEKRVAGLKSEMKKLQEQLSTTVEHEQGKLHNVMDSACLFALKTERSNLKRENGKLKGEVDDLSRKNASLAFEKYNLESKCDSLKVECSKLKRGVKGETFNAHTQTDSIWDKHNPSERTLRSQENRRPEVDSKVRLFMDKEEEPGQCAQQ